MHTLSLLLQTVHRSIVSYWMYWKHHRIIFSQKASLYYVGFLQDSGQPILPGLPGLVKNYQLLLACFMCNSSSSDDSQKHSHLLKVAEIKADRQMNAKYFSLLTWATWDFFMGLESLEKCTLRMVLLVSLDICCGMDLFIQVICSTFIVLYIHIIDV